jgi:hypothetical protein
MRSGPLEEWMPETCPSLLQVVGPGPSGAYSTLGNSSVEEFQESRVEEELEGELFLHRFLQFLQFLQEWQ